MNQFDTYSTRLCVVVCLQGTASNNAGALAEIRRRQGEKGCGRSAMHSVRHRDVRRMARWIMSNLRTKREPISCEPNEPNCALIDHGDLVPPTKGVPAPSASF
jgi:hypothetical protein